MWNVIGIISVLAGAYLIWSVVGRKFPQLKLIDLKTLTKERHAQVKSRIMKDRFDRSMGKISKRSASVASGLRSKIGRKYHGLYDKLKTMEAEAEVASPTEPGERDAKIARLLSSAKTVFEEGQAEDAESRYIEILRLDPHFIEAYRGLADVYIELKSYDQAKETLEFLLKLNKDDDRAFARLGAIEVFKGNFREAEERFLSSIALAGDVASYRAQLAKVYLQTGEEKKAWDEFRRVLVDEPYNPKYLDYFLEVSILIGDAESAAGALNALEAANPENAKLDAFRKRVEALQQPRNHGGE